MEYMMFINLDADFVPNAPGDPGFEEAMAEWFAYNRMLTEGGHFVSGASLQPAATATTVHTRTGTVTDGPFTESKEQVGGYYLIEAADLDEALALARRIPIPATIEVRPVMFRPDTARATTDA